MQSWCCKGRQEQQMIVCVCMCLCTHHMVVAVVAVGWSGRPLLRANPNSRGCICVGVCHWPTKCVRRWVVCVLRVACVYVSPRGGGQQQRQQQSRLILLHILRFSHVCVPCTHTQTLQKSTLDDPFHAHIRATHGARVSE